MKVLIIDDELLIRRSLSRIANERGHQVKIASDGQEGLNIWLAFRPDLVFLDVFLPQLDGPSLLKSVGKSTEKVVMISARHPELVKSSHLLNEENNFRSFLDKNVDLFIPKPFDDILAVFNQAEQLCMRYQHELGTIDAGHII